MKLSPCKYAIFEAAYLQLDDGPISDEIDTVIDANKYAFKIIKIQNCQTFSFNTAYGSGTFPIKNILTNENVGSVDCDYSLIVAPIELFQNDDFTKFAVKQFGFEFEIHKDSILVFLENGDIKIGNFLINTSDKETITFKYWEQLKNEGIKNPRVCREMSGYIMLRIMYDDMLNEMATANIENVSSNTNKIK